MLTRPKRYEGRKGNVDTIHREEEYMKRVDKNMKAINMYTCHTRVKTVMKRGRS
jgi:hypothetical protein